MEVGRETVLTSILKLDILPVNSQSIPQKMSKEFQLGTPQCHLFGQGEVYKSDQRSL